MKTYSANHIHMNTRYKIRTLSIKRISFVLAIISIGALSNAQRIGQVTQGFKHIRKRALAK